MTGFTEFFKNKTITLMGLGLLGRGVGDAAFLAQHCKKLFVTDAKTADELRSSVDALKDFANIEFVLGGHDMKLFRGVDFVVKGAGIRRDNPYLLEAQKNNIPIYMSTALFVRFAPIKTIGVTGTRGKSSTTYMIAEILQRAGKKVLLGGNVRGVSTLALLPQADEFDVAVLELDSWQLQGFDELQISPNISVFTTFYPDHMNYYDGDMLRYLQDKTGIFRHQKPGDVAIASAEVAEKIRQDDPGCLKANVPLRIAEALPSSFAMKIPGAHNLLNAGLAKAAAVAYGIDAGVIDAALHDFTGVEGRLQYIGKHQDRQFYNDSNATTQEATLAALTSFAPDKIVLIFGGADKGLPIDRMLAYIGEHKIRCVLIKGTGTDRVLEILPKLDVVGSMPDAVQAAWQKSRPGDHIVLSPAFASFGVFKNEYDRSDQYMRDVQGILAQA